MGYIIFFIVDTDEEKLRYQADHDLLTGILNRSAIVKVLVSNNARTRNQVVAAVMTDIDHFKRINDTHGHLVGDEVLKAVTRILGVSLRKGDSLGCFGGEGSEALIKRADKALYSAKNNGRNRADLMQLPE